VTSTSSVSPTSKSNPIAITMTVTMKMTAAAIPSAGVKGSASLGGDSDMSHILADTRGRRACLAIRAADGRLTAETRRRGWCHPKAIPRAHWLCDTQQRGVDLADDYKEIDLSKLRLDPENPRLRRDLSEEDREPDQLLRHFARTYNLIELARSMADKGFSPKHAEALLVVEEPPGSDTFAVIEGNRRLATMILLADADRRKELALSAEWDELSAAAAAKGYSFDRAPAIVYGSREDLSEYLGFRHITGPAQWRPEAKARFIARLLQDGRTVDDVWRRIGSKPRPVKRFAEAHAVYEQALEVGLDGEPIEAAFGVFYNALDTQGVRSYLGLSPQRDFTGLPSAPVPADRVDKLREFINLLYGEKDEELPSVLRESRELKDFSEVLLNNEATKLLIETRDLKRAYRVAGGGKTELLVLLKDSLSRLVEANGQAYEFKGDEEVKANVKRLVDLVRDMASRYEVEDE